MARGINKVILIGHLGGDPEVGFTPSGGAVANLRIATSETWKDKQTGENQERTEWHTVVLFNRLAEVAGEYLKKGAKIYIEGSLRTRKWQEKNGQDRYTTEILGNEMQMLDSRGSGGSGANLPASSESPPSYSEHRPQSSAAAPTNTSSASTPSTSPSTADLDDDIPF